MKQGVVTFTIVFILLCTENILFRETNIVKEDGSNWAQAGQLALAKTVFCMLLMMANNFVWVVSK